VAFENPSGSGVIADSIITWEIKLTGECVPQAVSPAAAADFARLATE
jgi:hypothetical protein